MGESARAIEVPFGAPKARQAEARLNARLYRRPTGRFAAAPTCCLQIRTRTLDGALGSVFEQTYPGLANDNSSAAALIPHNSSCSQRSISLAGQKGRRGLIRRHGATIRRTCDLSAAVAG
jgi:hypothetical protein